MGYLVVLMQGLFLILLGDRTELQCSEVRQVAYEFFLSLGILNFFSNKWITFAIDWYGFSRLDLVTVVRVLVGNPSNFPTIPESTMQGFVNADLMLTLMTTQVAF